MPVQKLKKYLDDHGVKYVTITHSRAYTAQEVAASAHIPGKKVAKSVMVKIDGDMAMVVVPATFQVDLELLQNAVGARMIDLATEEEFAGLFPGCEPGAMPPFGNLYGMDTFMDATLREDDEIAFNAGTHTEMIRLAFPDYVRMVQPAVLQIVGEMV